MKKVTAITLIAFIFIAIISGCAISQNQAQTEEHAYPHVINPFTSYLDIPGVTEHEIAEIERIRGENTSLSYGMITSTDAFVKENGEIGGYAALFSTWLTELFDIPFEIEFHPMNMVIEKLDSFEIDFSGVIMITPEHQDRYILTDVIAERRFVLFRMAGSRSLEQIARERTPRFAFVENAPAERVAAAATEPGAYEPVWVQNAMHAYRLLKEGEADAFFASSNNDALFVEHGDVVLEEFFPLIFNPVAMATANPDLEAIISVVRKAQREGANTYLNYLYNVGYHDYTKHKLFARLTDEERAFIDSAGIIPIAAFNTNFPLSFYDERSGEWEGIFFDLLDQITTLTGLEFKVGHDETATWPDMNNLLRNKEVAFSPLVGWTRERAEYIIWSDVLLRQDNFALLSKSSFRNVELNDIANIKVGLARSTVFEEVFNQWFPNHRHVTIYDTHDLALAGLELGEVDLVMSTQMRLMYLTHFKEMPDYKINYLFNHYNEIRFGYNKDEALLMSVIDKTLTLIDTERVFSQWMNRTYDYRIKMIEARTPWLTGVLILCVTVIGLVVLLLVRTHGTLREQKKFMTEIENARDAAQLASKTKTTFLANMSHEIRTPMNSIIGFTELAQDDETSPKTIEYLSNISDSAKWLLNIINDILDIAKIESGKIVLEHIPFDLQDVISQCLSAMMPKASEKGLTINSNTEIFDGVKLIGDPIRLRQIFMNLISNAIKFTYKGTIDFHTTIVKPDDSNIRVRFEVKDSGIGMRPEQIALIFEPFMQADDSVTRKYGGTGLGIPITKNIIDLMGGELTVESVPGIGSNFIFELIFEIYDDGESTETQKLMLNDIEKPMFEGEILVCEDNELNQQVISEHLSRIGLKTIVARNGKEGVDIIRERIKRAENNEAAKKPFDLILMDIYMPVMDGLEAMQIIQGLDIETPVIALTANIMSYDIEIYKTSGMPEYLGKPFTSQELWKCLVKYLPVKSYVTVDEQEENSAEEVLLTQLRTNFFKSNRDLFERFIQALDDDDLKLAHRMVHTLKSNAGQIKEERLREIATTVDKFIKQENIRPGSELTVILESELEAVLKKLGKMMAKSKENTVTEYADKQKALEILSKLGPMLVERNPESMNMLDEIHSIQGAEKLAHCVEEFLFVEALTELTKLKESLEN